MLINDDKKAFLLESLKDLYSSTAQLHEWIKNDNLPKDMSKTMAFLIESYFCDIAKELDYKSHLNKEREERFMEIRKANEKIRQLEEKLGSNKPIDGLKEQLKHLYEKVSDWWKVEGFNHVSEEKFTPQGGLHIRFCFMLNFSSILSTTPVSDKQKQDDHVQHLRDMGFEFADREKDKAFRKKLLDNEKNRELLICMLQKRFPSLKVHGFENQSSRDTGDFLIRYVDAVINDLADI